MKQRINFDDVILGQEEKKNTEKAKKILHDPDRLERLLLKAEEKLSQIPYAGKKLSDLPLLILMIRSYIRKEYTNLPTGTIAAAIGAVLYFVSPFDLIPDLIPGIGFLDDAAMLAYVMKLIGDDLKTYRAWRDEQSLSVSVEGRIFDVEEAET